MPEPQSTPQLRAVDITTGHGVVAAKIVGPHVEAHRAAAILDAVRKAIEAYPEELHFVVLDFSEVDFINSSGVAACVELAGELKPRGVRPVIFRATDNVRKIFEMVKGDRLYTIVRTVDELAGILGE